MPESVWDYPRPPAIEAVHKHLVIELDGLTLADTSRAGGAPAFAVKETSHPPTYYLPPSALLMDALESMPGSSFCEWKGRASYWSFTGPTRRVPKLAWSYADPTERFSALRDHLAFYPSKCDACSVDGERVTAQDGDFYGGWITPDIEGPFKGAPGTMGW